MSGEGMKRLRFILLLGVLAVGSSTAVLAPIAFMDMAYQFSQRQVYLTFWNPTITTDPLSAWIIPFSWGGLIGVGIIFGLALHSLFSTLIRDK